MQLTPLAVCPVTYVSLADIFVPGCLSECVLFDVECPSNIFIY